MEASTSTITTIIDAFQKGGFFMYPIAAALAFATALIVERWGRLSRYSIGSAESFMVEIQKHILANDVDGAIKVCDGASSAVLANVIKAGLKRSSGSESQIQNAIDAASLGAIPKLEKRLNYLATIANISTLLGLLGTITGLIRSFSAIALADATQRQAILSAGISEAMNCTAFGLIVAILAMIMHSILTNKATKLTEEIDEYGVKLLDLLLTRRYQHSSEKI